jgi:hypothetical protein
MPMQGLRARTRALLLLKDVQALVLVVQDDALLETGLPMDQVDVVHVVDDDLVTASHQTPLPKSNPRAQALLNVMRAWSPNGGVNAPRLALAPNPC